MSNFFNELKRRNVIKETIAYLIVAWLILQVLSVVLPIWKSPDWILQILTITLAIGLPLWILFSWSYEFTSSGIKKTANVSSATPQSLKTNRRLNAIIMVALIAVIALIWLNPSMVTSKTPALRHGIAVLPFENMSANAANAWFGDGVTEDILTHLSKIKGLRVISRTSVLQYKGTTKTIPEICKELGVSHIVEGSVRQLNNKVLISAQLISATDEHLWADNYDDDLDNAFEVQRNVSKEIVKQLQITISPEEEVALNKSLTNNQDAYKLYVKGRDLSDIEDTSSILQSVEVLKQAIALDPDFASAYAELANSKFLSIQYAGYPIDETITECKTLARTALAIDPDNARAYGVLGVLNAERGNSEEGRRYYEKSIELNPNDARVRHHYAIFFNLNNPDYKKYLIEINEAQRLSPFSYLINQNKIFALILNEKYEEADALLNEKKFIYQPLQFLFLSTITKSILNKDWITAVNMFKEALEKDPNNPGLHIFLAYFYIDILDDAPNMLTHAKKVYNLYNIGADAYGFAALYNEDFTLVEDLLEDEVFLNSIFKEDLNYLRANYYYKIGDFKKSLEAIDKLSSKELNKPFLQYSYPTLKLACYIGLGEEDKVQYIIKNDIKTYTHKALAFSVLKEKDSMYHYLNKISVYEAVKVNSFFTVQPYKQEARYKAFLKKNFLPIITK